MLTLTTTHGTFNGTTVSQIVRREFGPRAYVSNDLIVRRNRFRRTHAPEIVAASDHVISAILPDVNVDTLSQIDQLVRLRQ